MEGNSNVISIDNKVSLKAYAKQQEVTLNNLLGRLIAITNDTLIELKANIKRLNCTVLSIIDDSFKVKLMATIKL